MSETVSAPNASASLSIDRRFLATSAALAAGWGALPRERADISPPLSVFGREAPPHYAGHAELTPLSPLDGRERPVSDDAETFVGIGLAEQHNPVDPELCQ